MYQVSLSAATIQLIESKRQNADESVDNILGRALGPAAKQVPEHPSTRPRFNLGKGVWLDEGEKLFFFRYKSSLASEAPEATAEIKNGKFMMYGRSIPKSKGSYLQPAMNLYQMRSGDVAENGKPTSLDAWRQWYVVRGGKFIRTADLRDPNLVAKRRAAPIVTNLTLKQLGLD